MPLTVVVEPDPGGHRFQNAAHVVRRALARGDEVVLATSAGAPATAEFAAGLGDVTGVQVREVFAERHPRAADVLAQVLALTPPAGADVVLMEADAYLTAWWRAGPRLRRSRARVVVFLTRYPTQLTLRSGLDYWRVRVAKDLLVALALLTGAAVRGAGFAARHDARRGWPVLHVRDPVECTAHSRDRARLRAELGLPADRPLVGISGGINARKDPPLVLDAVEASGVDAALVLSGPVSDDVHAWLAGLPGERRARVIVDDGFLSSERLDASIAAVDVVVLAMQLEGPSGIQGKALAAGVPIVTAGSRTRELELRATGGGEAATPDAASMGAALRRVLTGAGTGPSPAAFDVPTGDTFAATILGED